MRMFSKSKCLYVLSRTNRYAQCRSIRKSNHLKYSAASYEGLSSKFQVKRNPSPSHNLETSEASEQHEEESFKEEIVSSKYAEIHSSPKAKYSDVLIASKKTKIEELIFRAEELLKCRFQRPTSSPIGVGVSASDNERLEGFNLLPGWFQSESALMTSRIPLLLSSGHPILRLKQNIDANAEEHAVTLLSNNLQWRAFIIMLVAKAFGHSSALHNESRKILESIEMKQQTLSEITEMMHFAFSLHRTIVEIKHSRDKDVAMEEKESVLHLGNKIAILIGDVLLARTSRGLSSLKNPLVTELMSDAIGDFSESEILRRRQLEFFKPVISGSAEVFQEFAERTKDSPGSHELPTYNLWRSRVALDIGSLIGRSCLCSTIFSQHDEGARRLAFDIGQQLGLVLQAYNELELYNRGRNLGQPTIDLCTLPVVFHLNSDSVDRIHKPLDISEIYRDVMTSPVALLQTQNTLELLKKDALRLIAKLPRLTPAPQILEDFIVTLS